MAKLNSARLRELFHYDPETGVFTRIKLSGPRSKLGVVVGTYCDGYRTIKVDGILHRAHRLAWLYMMGVWPEFLLDHKDTNRSNNAWENLRPATSVGNTQNAKTRSDSKTGVKGVYLARNGRYAAVVQANGKRSFLGYHPSIAVATNVVRKARESLHGDFVNHG